MHVHVGTVGGLANMVIGFGLWMFPMPRGAFQEGRARYSPSLVRTAYVGINAGLLLRFIGESQAWFPVMIGSGAIQAPGLAPAVISLWPRMRAIQVVPGQAP